MEGWVWHSPRQEETDLVRKCLSEMVDLQVSSGLVRLLREYEVMMPSLKT